MLNINFPLRIVVRFVACVVVGLCLSFVLVSTKSSPLNGSIQGIVTDQTGAVLSGAKVTVTNKATAAAVTFTASSAGAYSTGPIQPGDYSVKVEAKGFKTIDLPVTVQVGNTASGSVQMQLGQESQIVEVQGAARRREHGASYSAGCSDREPDRRPFQSTGATSSTSLSLNRVFRFRKAVLSTRPKTVSRPFPLAGDLVEPPGSNSMALTSPTRPWALRRRTFLRARSRSFSFRSLHSIFPPSLTSSGAVNVTTRSGSNSLHGEAFGLFHGNQAAARLPGPSAPPFQRQQWGGRLGGYIIKDKLFWFVDGERTKQDLTAAQPFSAPFNNLNTTLAQPYREILTDGKLDWQIRSSMHMFYRFNFDQNSQIRPFGAASSLQGFRNTDHTPSDTVGLDFNTRSIHTQFPLCLSTVPQPNRRWYELDRGGTRQSDSWARHQHWRASGWGLRDKRSRGGQRRRILRRTEFSGSAADLSIRSRDQVRRKQNLGGAYHSLWVWV